MVTALSMSPWLWRFFKFSSSSWSGCVPTHPGVTRLRNYSRLKEQLQHTAHSAVQDADGADLHWSRLQDASGLCSWPFFSRNHGSKTRYRMMNPQKGCLHVESRLKKNFPRNGKVIQDPTVWRCQQLSGNMDKVLLRQPKSPNSAKINVLEKKRPERSREVV